MQTRKYPRTLQEAFGPYTSRHIQDTHQPMHRADKIVMVACVLVTIGLTVALAVGWVK